MKNTIKNIVIALVLIAFAGSFSYAGDKLAFFQKKMDKLAAAILAEDFDTQISFYTEDSYSLPSYQPMIKGTEAMKKMHDAAHKNAMQKVESTKFTLIDVFGTKEQMVTIGKYDLTMGMKGQDKKMKDKGKFVSIWVKTADGLWKVKAEMWNTDMNPWAKMSGGKTEKK